jgi:hypothetical protein
MLHCDIAMRVREEILGAFCTAHLDPNPTRVALCFAPRWCFNINAALRMQIHQGTSSTKERMKEPCPQFDVLAVRCQPAGSSMVVGRPPGRFAIDRCGPVRDEVTSQSAIYRRQQHNGLRRKAHFGARGPCGAQVKNWRHTPKRLQPLAADRGASFDATLRNELQIPAGLHARHLLQA